MALTMKTQNLQQQKLYVTDGESKGNYSRPNPITFFKKSLESSLCDYYDAYILVKENITVKKLLLLLQVVIFKENNHLLQLHKKY